MKKKKQTIKEAANTYASSRVKNPSRSDSIFQTTADRFDDFEEAFEDGCLWMKEQMKPLPRVQPKDRLMFEELFAKVEGSSRTQKWKQISDITGFSIQTIRLSLRDSEEDSKEIKYFNPKQEMF